MQRRETVARIRGHERRFGTEELREPVDVAERGGLEDVERVDHVFDGFDERLVEAVEGPHERGHAARVPGGRERRVRVEQRLHAGVVTRFDRFEKLFRGACHGGPPVYYLDSLTKYRYPR